ncbi:hypothetical protein MFKK_17570 [Halopseudomonas aestusnigri]|uniref:hypothetical protein n=1 Tax=Halopseudomonas TaxID=2901189 RepID=UPI0022B6EE31|nr:MULTISPECIES: hypothetical protein [Halopseudomonas]BDX18947.1 hypothetical protein MFKK_17570 [Halopseudomonas aestusnigri]
MARNPNTTWEMLDHAMTHYQTFISNKPLRLSLSIVDLLHVSNFKGGNASITEPEATLGSKLKSYEAVLSDIGKKFNGKTLAQLDEQETVELISLCKKVTDLTKLNTTKIRGFGASYASALLSAHFMNLIPVLDRRILNGACIKVEYDNQKQVKDIAQHYGDLIKACRAELQKRNGLTLRSLDKEWFTKSL